MNHYEGLKVLVKPAGGQWVEVANQDTPGLKITVEHTVFDVSDEYGSVSRINEFLSPKEEV